MSAMTETARRDRFESTQWVAQCPECGDALEGNYLATGDDMSPKTGGHVGTPVKCEGCGWAGTIQPGTDWAQA